MESGFFGYSNMRYSRKLCVLFLVAMALLAMLLVSGCAEKECEVNSDCPKKTCFTTACDDNICNEQPISGCCGNGICEANKGESFCSCEEDCKKDKCEGKKVISETKYGKVETEYLEYMCNPDSECVLDFDKSAQREIPLLFEKQFTHFKVAVKVVMKKPFDIDNDKLEFELELKDISSDVVGPITVSSIQVLKKSYLYASQDLDKEIASIGDSFIASIPLDFEPETVEVELPLDIKIDYDYTYITDTKTGATKDKRDSYTTSLSEKLFIVKTGEKK